MTFIVLYELFPSFFVVVVVILSPRGFLDSTVWPHQNIEMTVERATSPIKATHPPCLFWLGNVNRSTTLIVMSSH